MESQVTTSPKVLFSKVRQMVPPLLEKFHKGQHGRVAVIGGCAEYDPLPLLPA
ncbi:hypothetical protein EYZ11_002091 [Aspergillus tanneri]|uniref:YjeF C-terminal domain-containing protein n=1 Tax=Aspergillus tanneri TaxID=1220188 RepID=A0A4S3JRR7_9EURO|nr:uncharacterized protein ATNIH1004_003217 [Aspergillus tanneri]KAA8650530.1 hypothetical protein ATNIH1004_003217 [Aspergillus tanneri]THC98432.1 hypothetical protein EYZ11_002091 [Aspergillus tanneri]